VLEARGDAYVLKGSLAQLHIPETLQDSLMARLDRAPRLREVAQLGSVLGREFAYDMISALAGIEEDMLQSGLGQLVVDELLYQRGRPPRSRYLFKHALIQDAAYQSLLKRTRQQYHQQAAKLLEDRFPEVASTQPELVAHHYTQANCPAQAIAYWHRAGMAAVGKSANLEAIDQFRRGLALVEALPDARQRAERELDLQMALGPALFATKSFSDPDIGRAYARASELCRQLGDHSREFTTLRGLYLHHLGLLEMEKAQHFAEEALRVAERLGDAARLVGGHMALGVTLLFQGKLEPALPHFRRGFQLFDPNMQFPDWPGSHPGVQCQFWPMLISWMLGYPDRSLDELRAAVGSAETLGHPLTLAQTLCFAAHVHIFRHEPPAAADCAGRALRICEEHRIGQYHALALCVNGWALGVSGESEKGLAQIGRGLDSYGLGLWQHILLALQADAQLAIGKSEAALASVTAGLQAVEQMGGSPLEAELHRLRGEALLAGAGTMSEAETVIEQGIDVARRQNAKSWELRGAMSLAPPAPKAGPAARGGGTARPNIQLVYRRLRHRRSSGRPHPPPRPRKPRRSRRRRLTAGAEFRPCLSAPIEIERRDAVRARFGILGAEDHPFEVSLRDKQSIERIRMMMRQFAGVLRMLTGDRQYLETMRRDDADNALAEPEFTDRTLDRDFPNRCRADKDICRIISDRGKQRWRDARRLSIPPEENMRVDQEPHPLSSKAA